MSLCRQARLLSCFEGYQDRARPCLTIAALLRQPGQHGARLLQFDDPGIERCDPFPCQRPDLHSVIGGIQCEQLADLLKRETGALG